MRKVKITKKKLVRIALVISMLKDVVEIVLILISKLS